MPTFALIGLEFFTGLYAKLLSGVESVFMPALFAVTATQSVCEKGTVCGTESEEGPGWYVDTTPASLGERTLRDK